MSSKRSDGIFAICITGIGAGSIAACVDDNKVGAGGKLGGLILGAGIIGGTYDGIGVKRLMGYATAGGDGTGVGTV